MNWRGAGLNPQIATTVCPDIQGTPRRALARRSKYIYINILSIYIPVYYIYIYIYPIVSTATVACTGRFLPPRIAIRLCPSILSFETSISHPTRQCSPGYATLSYTGTSSIVGLYDSADLSRRWTKISLAQLPAPSLATRFD